MIPGEINEGKRFFPSFTTTVGDYFSKLVHPFRRTALYVTANETLLVLPTAALSWERTVAVTFLLFVHNLGCNSKNYKQTVTDRSL